MQRVLDSHSPDGENLNVTATNIATVEAVSFLTDQGIAAKLTDSTFATNSNVVFSTFT